MEINTTPDYRNAPEGGRPPWTATVAGAHALAWEQTQVDHWVSDVFGYHAVPLGLPELQALRSNRMPHQWLVGPQDEGQAPSAGAWPAAQAAQVCSEFHALPFATNSLDLVVMPHTLEVAADAHQTLREAERVLRPEGRLLITGFNPASLWGAARRVGWPLGRQPSGPEAMGPPPPVLPHPPSHPLSHPLPDAWAGDWVGYWRLRDWLHLLSFEVEGGRFGCYVPPVGSAAWLDRLRWMDRLGDRWWPVLGSVYAVMAIKRVRGMRLVGLARQAKGVKAPARAVVTQRHQRSLPPGLQPGGSPPAEPGSR